MAGSIYIEAHEVEYAGFPLGAMHLYLVFRDTNGEEYVIRSGPENDYLPRFTDMEIEINVPMAQSADFRGSDTPEDRGSTPLDFAGLTDDQAWAIVVKYARMIDATDYPYNATGTNSNAFVGAMLAAAGGDPDAMLPSNTSLYEAVGLSHYDDILSDVPPPADGTVQGTTGADTIAGIQIDEVFRALAGADSVQGARGNDDIQGQGGADRLQGQYGLDTLQGGADSDTLNGGTQADLLDGGAGTNTLIGGADADVFLFAKASTSTIRDFEDGLDLIRIDSPAADSFSDLTITSFGANGEHTRIAYGSTVIEVLNLDRAHLDAGDVQFV